MDKKATELLEEEHHLIQKVIGAMAAMADKVFTGQPVEQEMLSGAVEFMRVFVDECHHDKEENYLFPLLAKKGVPVAGCPIGILINEHNASRKLTAELGAAVEAYGKDPRDIRAFLTTALRELVQLYPSHIWKENYLLFPMTDKILNDQEQQGLVEQFEMVESKIGSESHERFERLAEMLARRAQEM